jgi:membrane associated rhomboid family serine protease
LIPLKDNIPTDRFPILTVLFIAINIAVFVWQTQYEPERDLERAGFTGIDASAIEYGAIPYRLTHPDKEECVLAALPQRRGAEIACEGQPELEDAQQTLELDQAAWWATLLTSMFMHGGILHLAGNMLFLWIFGNNVEDSMGRLRFLAFYLLAGVIAVYAQSLIDTSSTVPTIGASGAVAGVLGGYALLHPRARVLTLVIIIFFVTLIEVPAFVMLGIWFVLQFLPAVGQTAISEVGSDGGVAYFAHVGGFIFGLAAIKLFASRHRERSVEPPYPVY